MNARKHRKPQQAKETDRLGPKGMQSVRVLSRNPTRTARLPVYRAGLNHPVNNAEHGNAVVSARVITGQASPQGGSRDAALGGPKKPMPAVTRWICPRRSGQSWQEKLQNHRETEKANDG